MDEEHGGEIRVRIKTLALIRVARDSGQQRRDLLAASPYLNCRTELKLPKIMPLCTHICFAHAVQLADRSCPGSKFPALKSLAGKLSVYRGAA